MPTILDLLTQTKTIHTSSSIKVEQTIAQELKTLSGGRVEIKQAPGLNAPAGTVRLGVVQEKSRWRSIHPSLDGTKDWMMARVKSGGGVELLASRSHLLYYLFAQLTENWKGESALQFTGGRILHPSFRNLRPVYDLFLTQHARTVRNFDREEHIRNLSRLGFSHAEVNGLAFAVPFERGPQGKCFIDSTPTAPLWINSSPVGSTKAPMMTTICRQI